MEARMREAAKLGFDCALAPNAAGEGSPPLTVMGSGRLAEAVRRIGDEAWGALVVKA
jgi:DNA repair protein RadA/Sms